MASSTPLPIAELIDDLKGDNGSLEAFRDQVARIIEQRNQQDRDNIVSLHALSTLELLGIIAMIDLTLAAPDPEPAPARGPRLVC